MPTLVTGGGGFIGSHLVRLLVDSGESVRVLERSRARVDHLHSQNVDIVFGDIRDRQAVDKAVAGCSRVYHLAADPNLWTHKRGHFNQVNHIGTINVLEAALRHGAVRVLHTSTESILTRVRQSGPIAEDQRVVMSDVIGPYCRSKFLAERYAMRLARAGAPIVIVNPTLPIGPGDFGRSPPTRMILDFCLGKRREYLDAALNLIDVRDVALGMQRAMEHGRFGRRYLLGHENLSIRAIFVLLARITGLPEPSRRIPYWVALAAAYADEFIADVFTQQPPVATVTGVKLTRRSMRFDPSSSLSDLGLRPRPVEQSLRDAFDWFRAVGWLPAAH
jgi:dihydroflavonol-4-reductase